MIMITIIVGMVCVIYSYRIYDASRQEQSRIKKVLKVVEKEVSQEEKEQNQLEKRVKELEGLLENSTEVLIENATRELGDNNPSRLARSVKALEDGLLPVMAEVAARLLQPLVVKEFDMLNNSQIKEALNYSLIRVCTVLDIDEDELNQLKEINDLCRQRGLSVYVPVLHET